MEDLRLILDRLNKKLPLDTAFKAFGCAVEYLKDYYERTDNQGQLKNLDGLRTLISAAQDVLHVNGEVYQEHLSDIIKTAGAFEKDLTAIYWGNPTDTKFTQCYAEFMTAIGICKDYIPVRTFYREQGPLLGLVGGTALDNKKVPTEEVKPLLAKA